MSTGATDGAAAPAAPVRRVGPLVAGGVMLAAALGLFVEAWVAGGADRFAIGGPRLAPLLVTGGWAAMSVVYLVEQVRHPEGTAERPRWLVPAALVVSLLGYAVLYDRLGFVVTTTAFFVVASRLLGSRKLWRDVAVAIGLALVVYLAFTRALDIQLPKGVLPL